MKTKTRSLLEEIFETNLVDNLTKLDQRADHVLTSAFNLVDMIDKLEETEKVKEDLIKRFLLSIKTRDKNKFKNTLKKIRREKDEVH